MVLFVAWSTRAECWNQCSSVAAEGARGQPAELVKSKIKNIDIPPGPLPTHAPSLAPHVDGSSPQSPRQFRLSDHASTQSRWDLTHSKRSQQAQVGAEWPGLLPDQ